MPTIDHALHDLLLPELAMLAAIDPVAGRQRRRAMAADAMAFSRGSLALQVRWMVAHAGSDAPWTWAVGDPHQGNFSTLATGPLTRDGRAPVTYGISDIDDEHPAPWHWDLLRLLASVATVRPTLRRGELVELAGLCLDEYARTMTRCGDDDETAALRIDLHGLPEALKALVEEGNHAESGDAHLQRHVSDVGKHARLRLGKALVEDRSAREVLLPALERAFAKLDDLPEHQLLDAARREGGFGLSSLGRRRWLALLRERDPSGDWRLRLIEIKERRPSVLSRFIPVLPFAPHGRPFRSLSVAMGGDPYQCVLHPAAGDCLVRTRCHARTVLAVAGLDRGDLVRLARLWGQLLAAFHVAGLGALLARPGARIAEIAADAKRRGRLLGGQAWELSRFNQRQFAAFVDTCRKPRR